MYTDNSLGIHQYRLDHVTRKLYPHMRHKTPQNYQDLLYNLSALWPNEILNQPLTSINAFGEQCIYGGNPFFCISPSTKQVQLSAIQEEKTPPKTKPCFSFTLPEFLLGSEIGLEEELDCQL